MEKWGKRVHPPAKKTKDEFREFVEEKKSPSPSNRLFLFCFLQNYPLKCFCLLSYEKTRLNSMLLRGRGRRDTDHIEQEEDEKEEEEKTAY